jgi:hypothetical protein
MKNTGVWQDSDTERPDPNLPDTWEAKRLSRERMEERDDDIWGDADKSWVWKLLDDRDPARARRRFGTLYWKASSRVMMAFFLTLFGVTFCIVGLACALPNPTQCDEPERGVGFGICGLLMVMPGLYGATTLLQYLRGTRGYHYRDLPEMN